MSLTGSRFSSDSAPRALPSWDSKTRWNNLSGDPAVNVIAGSSGHTNSPHPSSREGHHSTVGWSSISSYCVGSCTDLRSIAKDFGVIAVAKLINTDQDAHGITEAELTALATEHATKLYPSMRPDAAFAKLFSDASSIEL